MLLSFFLIFFVFFDDFLEEQFCSTDDVSALFVVLEHSFLSTGGGRIDK